MEDEREEGVVLCDRDLEVNLFGEEDSESEGSASDTEGVSKVGPAACTVCGKTDEYFPQYCHRNPFFSHPASCFATCRGRIALCGHCHDERLKMNCVKCERWECQDCRDFDRTDGKIGMEFTSQFFALEPSLCVKCSRIYCKECSHRCERCRQCVCLDCAPKNYFFMCCDKCLKRGMEHPEKFPGGREEVLCYECAAVEKRASNVITCPVKTCTEVLKHEADLKNVTVQSSPKYLKRPSHGDESESAGSTMPPSSSSSNKKNKTERRD